MARKARLRRRRRLPRPLLRLQHLRRVLQRRDNTRTRPTTLPRHRARRPRTRTRRRKTRRTRSNRRRTRLLRNRNDTRRHMVRTTTKPLVTPTRRPTRKSLDHPRHLDNRHPPRPRILHAHQKTNNPLTPHELKNSTTQSTPKPTPHKTTTKAQGSRSLGLHHYKPLPTPNPNTQRPTQNTQRQLPKPSA